MASYTTRVTTQELADLRFDTKGQIIEAEVVKKGPFGRGRAIREFNNHVKHYSAVHVFDEHAYFDYPLHIKTEYVIKYQVLVKL